MDRRKAMTEIRTNAFNGILSVGCILEVFFGKLVVKQCKGDISTYFGEDIRKR